MIGAGETVRVKYGKGKPQVESERRTTSRQNQRAASQRAGVKGQKSHAGKRLQTTKRDERERRQNVIRLRRAGLIAAVIAIVVLVVWAVVSIYRAPIFTVKRVDVTGTKHLSREEVLKLAAIPDDATLLRVSPSALERRIGENAWVADVKVERDYPSGIDIAIKERAAAAVVDAGGTRVWVVSDDMHWLGLRSAEETGLIAIRDVEKIAPKAGARVVEPAVRNAAAVLQGLSPQLLKQVSVISAPTIDKTALVLENDVEVFMGAAERVAAKDRIVREILAREKGKVVYINVRVVERPTWRGLSDD